MRINSLKIINFKALKNFEITSTSDMVILAGPNGCGKSCVLDAIRLLKSAYGGYVANEAQSWFAEFNIIYKSGRLDAAPLLNDRDKSLSIEAKFKLADEEIKFLRGDITEFVRDIAVNESVDAPFGRFRTVQSLATQARQSEPAIQLACTTIKSEIESELATGMLNAELTINPDGSFHLKPSRLLEFIFSTFKPNQIGVIDFQTSNRNFKREPTGSINISLDQTIDQTSEKAKNHSLYNHDQRYTDLKQQLAAAYIKTLISAEAGGENSEKSQQDLTDTLKELFATFIPGKTFLGPQPSLGGTLRFDITTSSGATHDIYDLSSGEKAVLYGYLLLRNRTPKNSILMIDEPELHLNPRLIADLPAFYFRHLGKALGNQIWLVTHSDAIVRGAVSTKDANVLHLQPAESGSQINQATSVCGDSEMKSLVLSLVGDLAAFRPTAPIVVFEGGGESDNASEFDIYFVTRLFPEFIKKINPVSGHDKKRVHQIHDALAQAKAKGLITQNVYSVVDQDDEGTAPPGTAGGHIWDRYHIENYLLEPRFIREALIDICGDKVSFSSDEQVAVALKECAGEVTSTIVQHRVLNFVRGSIIKAVNIGCAPNAADLQVALEPSITSTRNRLETMWATTLTEQALASKIEEIATKVETTLSANEWHLKLPGRDILRAFAAKHAIVHSNSGIGYDILRNSILGRMATANHQPEGMLETLRKIVPEK